MESHDIRVIKWGIIFFSKSGKLTFDENEINIIDSDDRSILSCGPADIRKANYNSLNGMITLKTTNDKKANLTFVNDDAATSFSNYLDSHNIAGFSI